MENKQSIYQFIEESREQMIQLQTELSAIPAMSPDNGGDGETKKAACLIGWIKKLGIMDIQVIDAPDSRVSHGVRPNIIATVPGKRDDIRFWIMTHVDVVPPGDLGLWETEPYKVEVQEDRIIGRGVEDNQQSLTASLFAAAAFVAKGITPEYTIKLLFAADEETGSEFGISYLLETQKLFKKEDLILVPDHGAPDSSEIEIAEKSLMWIKFQTTGKQCHASMPELGNNAFVAASALVVELQKLKEIFNNENSLFNPPVSTFSPTKKEANVPNINTIPGDDIFYLDCRVLPETDIKTVMEEIMKIKHGVEKTYNVKIEVTQLRGSSSPATPQDTPLVGKLQASIKEVLGREAHPMGIGGGTVGAELRKEGFDTVVWSTICDTAHMPGEYSIINNMIGDSKVMASLMAGETES